MTCRLLVLWFVAAANVGCHFDVSLGDGGEQTRADRRLQMVAQPGNTGWMLSFTGLAVEPDSMRVKFGDEPFRTLRKPVLALRADAEAAEVVVYYTIDGKEHGPETFSFDPRAAQLEFSKDMLGMLHTSWVAWRNYAGKTIVYFTALNMHACALSKVEYGFGSTLDNEWVLPPCRGPAARIETSDRIMLDAPAGARSISLRLTFIDGEQTAIEHFPNDAPPE